MSLDTVEQTNERMYEIPTHIYEKSSTKDRHLKEQGKCPKSNIDKDIRAYQ